MKTLVFVLALLVSQQAHALDADEVCYEVADSAEAIMQFRQMGGDRAKFLSALYTNKEDYAQKTLVALLNFAFLLPVHANEQDKLDAIYNFRMRNYDNCLKSVPQRQ